MPSVFQWVYDNVKALGKLNVRQMLLHALNFTMMIASALAMWKMLVLGTSSDSPIVVVLSGSMRPAFDRGDILFLSNYETSPLRVGEIVVYQLEDKGIPIVHRIIKLHEFGGNNYTFLTKGDNNTGDDRPLYRNYGSSQKKFLERKDVIGRAKGSVPLVGYITILFNDIPAFRYVACAVVGTMVFLQRE